MKKFETLKKAVESAEIEAKKFYENGNKAAGTRLRKHMLEIKKIAQAVREDVSDIKNS